MPGNIPLNSSEQEKLTPKEIKNQEIHSRPGTEFKEGATETQETGAVRETEGVSGEESVAEPTVMPVRYAKIKAPAQPKTEQLRQIENIMSENLKEVFLEMTPEKQIEFKREGERVAGIIYQMIFSAKIQVKKIISLLAGWLKRLPGVNKYFIEQESKIKADKIINLTK